MMTETYWHGGPRIEGDLLSPPTETGFSRVTEDDFVYIAKERHLALMYAVSCNGWLYEVEPIGEIEQDPDSRLKTGESLRCKSARILRRFKPSKKERETVLHTLNQILPGITAPTECSKAGCSGKPRHQVAFDGVPTGDFLCCQHMDEYMEILAPMQEMAGGAGSGWSGLKRFREHHLQTCNYSTQEPSKENGKRVKE